MTAAGLGSGSALSIGAVLAHLKPDFPDVSISKIRFLESEGLVTPERTPSGYRQFKASDVARLRYVLTAQRDHYLPLKVIKEQLDAIERGLEPATPTQNPPSSRRRTWTSIRLGRSRNSITSSTIIDGRSHLNGGCRRASQRSVRARRHCR